MSNFSFQHHPMQRIFVLTLLLSLLGCGSKDPEKISLRKTNWYSQFYIYSNFYHFGTDGRGYSDDGQAAWSCPIDYKAKKIPGSKILYAGPQKFRYQIKNDTLTINYLDHELESRIFIYRKERENWLSLHSYTYGYEVMKAGERKEFFDEGFEVQE